MLQVTLDGFITESCTAQTKHHMGGRGCAPWSRQIDGEQCSHHLQVVQLKPNIIWGEEGVPHGQGR